MLFILLCKKQQIATPANWQPGDEGASQLHPNIKHKLIITTSFYQQLSCN
ncbi:MAG: hypothetical protein K0B37_01670 [Bacteroidales bacterium]|nr:hypothetical protein [Bacteroidales bacterium]